MHEIIEIITTVGFPIAMCVFLLYERTKNHEKSMAELRDAITDLHILIAEKL